MSARHQEGLAHLLYGVETGGFVALTGEVGTGKTTLCQCLLQQLPEQIDLALILNPKLNAIELLAAICDELSIRYEKDRQTLKSLVDALNHHLLKTHAEGKRTVLIIDEAQNLSLEVLEQIRLLTNLETAKAKLLQIVLVGQPELKQMLSMPELRQLNQRITARYHLLPLDLKDTFEYIRHRLRKCSGNPNIFKQAAVRRIFQLSSGIPRIINILCDRSLLGAFSLDTDTVTVKIVNKAAEETLNSFAPTGNNKLFIFAAVILLGVAIIGFYQAKTSGTFENIKVPLPTPSSKSIVSPENVIPKARVKIPESSLFKAFIQRPDLTLNHALRSALLHRGYSVPFVEPVDCTNLKGLGLQCEFNRATWHTLKALNSPVIMEFALPDNIKRYALLTGIKGGQPVFNGNPQWVFSLANVLSFWNGYYLLLEEPALAEAKPVFPNQQSGAVVWLRRQLDLLEDKQSYSRQPDFFDEALRARVIEFQRRHSLDQDGVVGSRTIARILQQRVQKAAPQLQIIE